ncbi:hypothetical protein PV10_07739 [Exophiala mesophila]|uniref:Uncharacterized protein n=1 Tax=Exophiala mesophila TaxID=212818 RepID=A0A0D1WN25_EXOME|nr:uncharacterized protein PV10_07739 [Exophiala mesophila]KIV90430.1 hypothetical protein PV10_07739 [Exophiala mesophila]
MRRRSAGRFSTSSQIAGHQGHLGPCWWYRCIAVSRLSELRTSEKEHPSSKNGVRCPAEEHPLGICSGGGMAVPNHLRKCNFRIRYARHQVELCWDTKAYASALPVAPGTLAQCLDCHLTSTDRSPASTKGLEPKLHACPYSVRHPRRRTGHRRFQILPLRKEAQRSVKFREPRRDLVDWWMRGCVGLFSCSRL